MIAAPTRIAAPARAPSASGAAIPEAGEAADAAEAAVPLSTRIAALVARASTPQDEALERQRQEFDFITRVRAETEREINALRDMAMEQMKQDDALLKKWIALIT
jgi:hypothetical protein